jgi:hypothetical protein
MPSHPTQFILSPTKEDKIFVRFKAERGKVVEFTIQYYAKTPKGWRTIRRYDTAHNHAHMDIYSFQKRGKMQQVHLEGEYGDIYTSALRKVKQEYQKLKEDYFL